MSRVATRVLILAAAATAACSKPVDGGGSGGGGGLQFVDTQCVPDIPGGEPIIEGQSLSCSFRLEGKVGSNVSVRCEDATGAALDCGASSRMQLQPFGSHPLPLQDGSFVMPTDGFGGRTRTVVWVAESDGMRATRRLNVAVSADDGVNGPPSIGFNCGGDTDGTVSVTAGTELSCLVRFADPDPDMLSWSYAQLAGPTPANEATPFGGAGTAPLQIVWRWSTAASDAGKTWTYGFSVNDGVAPAVTRNLVISVQ